MTATLLVLVLCAPGQAQYEHFFTKQAPGVMAHPECTSDSNIDVIHYQLDYWIDPPAELFSGEVTVTCRALVDSLAEVILNVRSNLTVDSVAAPGVSWQRYGDNLFIELDRLYHTGETLALPIYNHGTGPHPDYKGLFFSYYYDVEPPIPVAYTLTEPWGSAAWFVCKDDPTDKADSLRLIYTVPEGMTAVGNGTLISQTVDEGTVTATWEQLYPISTYLIFIALADYVNWEWSCTVSGAEMPLHFDVYPDLYDDARQDWQDLPEMVEFYSEIFDPYPFTQHGYNMVSIKGWTAMEHQTCTSYGRNFIQGNNHFDCVVAHELGHQWFGDLVTCDDWGDLWLNESFATWLDALWFGHDDYTGYHDRLLEMKEEYRNRLPGVACLPTWDPSLDSLFDAHTYQRGAWILHMMRLYIGEEPFLGSVNVYLDTHAWGTATTEQFLDIICGGHPLLTRDIFTAWLTSSGLPLFQWGWRQEADGLLRVLIHLATPPCRGEYLTPFTLRLNEHGFISEEQILLTAPDGEFAWYPERAITQVWLDPDQDVFCDREELPFVEIEALMLDEDRPEMLVIAPNPVQNQLQIQHTGWDELEVYDILGRLRLTLPLREAVVPTSACFDVSSLPSGVYLLRVERKGGYTSRKFCIIK